MTEKLPSALLGGGRGLGKSNCWGLEALWGLLKLCVAAKGRAGGGHEEALFFIKQWVEVEILNWNTFPLT